MFPHSKIQNISFAVITISVYVRRKELRQRLEKLAFELIESSGRRDYEAIRKIVETLEEIIKFGKTIYEIEPVNADAFIAELQQLSGKMRQLAELPNSEELPDIRQILSREEETKKQKVRQKKQIDIRSYKDVTNDSAKESVDPVIKINNPPEKPQPISSKIKSGDDNPAMRQSAILEKMRQFNGKPVHLKDVIGIFPKISERTVRYDLQRLSNDGLIERIGSGGPGTSYKIRIL